METRLPLLLPLLLPVLLVLVLVLLGGVTGTGFVMRMFSGFTSRCSTPFSWQCLRASSTCLQARNREWRALLLCKL